MEAEHARYQAERDCPYTLRGRPFFHGSIDRILLQEQYTGRYLDNTKDDAGRLPPAETQIEVECPRIIDPDQAARVAALRARRAPAVTAPRIVNSPTLLTGVAACGMPGCAAGLTISTGKGGRYSYYKCAAKVNGGTKRCTCPTLPMTALDNIVLEAVAERVLQPDRLTELLSGIVDASETADAQRQEDIIQARKALTRCETAISRLL
jgi:site-specific DNA recombinase